MKVWLHPLICMGSWNFLGRSMNFPYNQGSEINKHGRWSIGQDKKKKPGCGKGQTITVAEIG